MEAALLPVDAGFQFSTDDFNDEWEKLETTIDTVEDLEKDPLDDQMGPWAHKQYLDKYSWKDEDGEPIEVWPDTAYRVVRHELGALGYTDHDPEFQALVKLIIERKLLPGGRKLAQAGRQFHQTNNCFLYRCEDSREGWADLVRKSILSLSCGGGIGVVYSDVRPNNTRIKKTGGVATGPLSPANMVYEIARHVMQGGQRRCLPVDTFVHLERGLVPIQNVQIGDQVMTYDGYHTVQGNISQGQQQTILINTQMGDFECTPNHRVAVLANTLGDYDWKEAQNLTKGDRMIFVPQPIEGIETSLPDWKYTKPKMSTTCKDIIIPELDLEMAWFIGLLHGDGCVSVRVKDGYNGGSVSIAAAHDLPDVADEAERQLSRFGTNVMRREGDGKCWDIGTKSWQLANYLSQIKKPNESIEIPDFILQGTISIRAAYVAGLFDADGSVSSRPVCIAASVYPTYLRQVQALCASLGLATRLKMVRPAKDNWQSLYHLNVTDKRHVERFAFLMSGVAHKEVVLQSTPQFSYAISAGMGKEEKIHHGLGMKNYDADIAMQRFEDYNGEQSYTPVKVKGIQAGRVIDTYDIEVEGRNEFVAEGMLVHNSAIWGGLHWNHPDVFDWIHCKDWSDEVRAAKAVDQHAHAEMDMTNISVILDTEFFEAYKNDDHPQHELAHRVYWETTANMVKNGEPGFSIDAGENEGENLRNACTELCSSDDSDVCNLGSINLARVKTLDEFKEIIRLATLLLLAGTVYSDVPHSEIIGTREKNRRLGLGLMGLHEWLLVRGYRYEMVPELREWLAEYEKSTEIASKWADQHNLSRPVKTRAIAPNGTIGIVAETTTSAEPIFCVAYKRRFLDMDRLWKYQYVIDPTAYHLIEEMGVAPDDIEDAYSLAYNIERRIKFQADLQDYVDHGISSTLNLPYPIVDEAEVKDFGDTLMKYLPRLRGVTAYPNGSRSGQPLEAVDYKQAIGKAGLTFEDSRDEACVGGACGV